MTSTESTNKATILIADSDPAFLSMLRHFLENENYIVEQTDNGKEALEIYQSRQIDLVLIDSELPVTSGFEVCSAIKARPEGDEAYILMLTALEDEHFINRAFESGATDYLTKPLRWPVLRNRINYLLQVKDYRKELRLASLVFDNTSQAILVTDRYNRILAVNQAFSRITGYSRSEAIGKQPSFLSSGKQDKTFYERLWSSLKNEGTWAGEIWNRRKNGEIYPESLTINVIKDARGNAIEYVALFADISQQKKYEQDIWHKANFDPLTNLPNRYLLMDRLNQAIDNCRRKSKYIAVMMIDLDRFKEVNDTYGHLAGDQLLVEIARRLKECLRRTDTVARLGGDEFTVILTDMDHFDKLGEIANMILRQLSLPVKIDHKHQASVSASIGISQFPTDGTDIKSLLDAADTAMYHAKSAGRNRYSFFSEDSKP